jgi:protein-tyrosine phosphatase
MEDIDRFGINHIINVGGFDLSHLSNCYQFPLTDDGNNPEDAFSTILANLGEAIERNRRVLVCCRAGMSRSVFIVILWLERIGMSRSEAYDFVKKKHPVAQVNPDLLRCV